MDFIFEPWHWFVLGILLILSELILPAFAALWFGIAAVVVSILLWLFPNMSFTVQMVCWIFLSISCTIAWFKFIKPLSVDRTKAGLGGSVIIGETGMIIVAPQLERAGVVRFSVPIVGAAEWMCRTSGEQVAVGDRVIVTDIVGNELIVSSMQAQAVINKNS